MAQIKRPLSRAAFYTWTAASVADADAPHDALAPAIDMDGAAPVAVAAVIGRRRRDPEAEAEAVVMMVVMVMMVPLRELQERLLRLRVRHVVGQEDRVGVLHGLEQVGVGLSRGQRALRRRRLRGAHEAQSGDRAQKK